MKLHRLLTLIALLATSSAVADVTVTQLADRVRVEIDGQLFTEYRHADGGHPHYWPLIGPGGAKMTRSWPQEEVPGEQHDHIHQRSLWFAHGKVDGVDYWAELASFGGKPAKWPVGKIIHDRIVAVQSGDKSGEIISAQKWIGPDGAQPLTSTQRLVVYAPLASERVLDFEITMKAGAKDVIFSETREGVAALRIAESMRTRQPKNSAHPAQGRILNSDGIKDADVWGKPAEWVAMSGPINGKPYTISFFDHPRNLRHPSRWHAREYGLFAANPFGGAAMDKSLPKGAGDYTLKAGETLTLKYRIVIEQTDADAAKIGARYAEYSK